MVNDGSASPQVCPSKSVVDGRTWLAYARLDYAWLVHGTVVFGDGDFGCSDSSWRKELVAYMRRNVRPAPRRIAIPVQIHGSRVTVVGAGGVAGQLDRASDSGASNGAAPVGDPAEAVGHGGYLEVPACDGLVTGARGVVIGVNTADCIPLFAVNRETRTVGIAHCGWRGIAAGVVENLIEALGVMSLVGRGRDVTEGREGGGDREGRGGLATEDGPRGSGGWGGTLYVIGASVGRCCYDVGADLLDRFSDDEVKECSSGGCGGKTTFDLKKLVRRRLIHRAIDPAAIFTDNTCTSCLSDMLCSYRVAGDACGRMYSFLLIA